MKECLIARGMQLDGTCPMCHTATESISHAFHDCSVVKPTWHQLSINHNNTTFFSHETNEWLTNNAKSKRISSSNHRPWNITFPFAIWYQHNQLVFKGRRANPQLAKGIIMQATEFAHCISRPRGNQLRVITQIRWEKPNTGWVKLNTNGSSAESLNKAGSGGLTRDEQGNWIVGFTRNIGQANSFIAET